MRKGCELTTAWLNTIRTIVRSRQMPEPSETRQLCEPPSLSVTRACLQQHGLQQHGLHHRLGGLDALSLFFFLLLEEPQNEHFRAGPYHTRRRPVELHHSPPARSSSTGANVPLQLKKHNDPGDPNESPHRVLRKGAFFFWFLVLLK